VVVELTEHRPVADYPTLVERTAELESLIRLRVPLAQGYLLGRPAEPWATLPGELAATIRDRQTARTFEDSVLRIEQLVRRLLAGPRP
jgi:hypothetical protein